MKNLNNTNAQSTLILKPQFVPKESLSKEQLEDPDYRLKALKEIYGDKYQISCSKCHHCR